MTCRGCASPTTPPAFDFYSPEEIRRLADHAEHEQDGIAYLVAAFTGIRRGELVALLWEDVDFANHSIRAWEQVDRTGERGHPKSRRSRTVPMIDQAAEALQRLKDRGYLIRPRPRLPRRGRRHHGRLSAAPALPQGP
jgi:integrase